MCHLKVCYDGCTQLVSVSAKFLWHSGKFPLCPMANHVCFVLFVFGPGPVFLLLRFCCSWWNANRLLFSPFSFSGVLICHCLLQLERLLFCPSSLSFLQVDQHAVACSWLIKAISNYVHSGGKSKPRIRCRRRTRYTVQRGHHNANQINRTKQSKTNKSSNKTKNNKNKNQEEQANTKGKVIYWPGQHSWWMMSIASLKGLVWRETTKQKSKTRKWHRHTKTSERSNTTRRSHGHKDSQALSNPKTSSDTVT